jgi:drug/metabolite transporter (DMT)-like permease
MSHKTSLNKAIVILGFGLLATSTSAIFTKMCLAPAMAIACWRVGLASLFYYTITRTTSGPIHTLYSKAQFSLALLSGTALALHFITWITSLRYTSVASSVVLVATSPIWVALGGFLFLREKPRPLLLMGILLAMGGSVVISGSDFYFDPQRLTGNVLAILGAMFAAVYLLIGRRLRASVDTFPYVTAVYGSAALVTLVFIFTTRTQLFGFEPKTYLLLFAIAIFPQIIGHTSFNWALKYFSATVVAVVTLGEPIGASILAWIILGENLSLLQALGGGITLVGLFMALMGEAGVKLGSEFLKPE